MVSNWSQATHGVASLGMERLRMARTGHDGVDPQICFR